jgi:hypothetical protein
MSLRRKRERLKIEILETAQLAEGVADHPIMSFPFKSFARVVVLHQHD